jgi:hypothetical protein
MWNIQYKKCRGCPALRNGECELGFKIKKEFEEFQTMGMTQGKYMYFPLEPCPKPKSRRILEKYLEELST